MTTGHPQPARYTTERTHRRPLVSARRKVSCTASTSAPSRVRGLRQQGLTQPHVQIMQPHGAAVSRVQVGHVRGVGRRR